MVKQFNILNETQIIPTALHTEMERSYLEYAMSVIVGRALPDVRDGLKPVHRRIIYAMYELGLTPDRPFRKCARVVGDVLGKYHPHGDQSVYDAMVRLIQDFSSRYPLLSGHGNFGSIDNDPAAAMRYTETRLAAIAFDAVLDKISESTVNFTNNFDNSQQEPVILPAKLPILLLNGCSGIAVGMATNIPPHNLGEVVDGLIALIDNPDLPDQKLCQLIPAPDFPTGGEIIDTQGIKEAYLTGKGIIPLRGVATIENITHNHKKRNREKTAIIVTELPFQVNKAAWIEKIAELVNLGKLADISDIRDESDRDGIRVVIELKKDVNPETVLQELFHKTALQTNFGVIMLGLVDNKPCQLSLKEILQEFLKFRETTLTRQYSYQLEENQNRLHLLEGLLKALNQIDKVVDILRNCADGTTAKLTLQGELEISDSQANSILAMPLRRLIGLEKQQLEEEYQQLLININKLQILLGDRQELLRTLKKELRSLKRKFADERRTKILTKSSQQITEKIPKQNDSKKEEIKQTNMGDKIAENPILHITEKGYIYWQNKQDISLQPSLKKHEDLIIKRELILDNQQLMAILDSGKSYPISVTDIPYYSKKKTFQQLLSDGATKEGNKPLDYFFLSQKNINSNLVLLTKQGKLKRILGEELNNIGNRGLMLIKLREKDHLYAATFITEGESMIIATNGGRILHFSITDNIIPIMGRSAQGNQGIKLRAGEEIIACQSVKDQDHLLFISELGYSKIVSMNNIRKVNLNNLGTQAFRFEKKEDHLLSVLKFAEETKVILITNQERKILFNIKDLLIKNEDQDYKTLIKLNPQEKIKFVINWVQNFE